MSAVSKIFIIHGFTAGPDSNWFAWLKQQAQRHGVQAHVLEMPESFAPNDEAWQLTLQNEIHHVDENTFFVGHSLGCVTALRFIESLKNPATVGGAVMVSGFSQSVETLPELESFTRLPLDFDLLKKRIHKRAVLLSLNDRIVAPIHSLHLSQDLDADLHGIPRGGHFLDHDGYQQFEKVWEVLHSMMR